MTAARLPDWLPDGCPSWCDYGELHKDVDAYDDRTHCRSALSFPLTAEEPLDEHHIDRDGAEVDVSLIQHYREASPRVWLGREGSRQGMHLTLDEAERLARELLARVALARGLKLDDYLR
jgi:hypothetical protein